MKDDRTKFFAGEQYVMSKVRVLFAINTTSLGLVCPISELIRVTLPKELVLVFEEKLAPHPPVTGTNY